ncbi:MAG: FlgD immunoglobulin-like domain containing protein [Candidatus Fermentibacteraceae bacterium]
MTVFLCLAALAPAETADAQTEPGYMVQSEFGDPLSCDMMAQGIFLVWWDIQNDLSEEAAVLLDSMSAYRQTCLDSLEMEDPPNPQDGYYFNVYLHEEGDVFPDGWACGVGTDCYGYPYMTLPIGVLGNWMTISHESFHVFQYSSDAPGFDDVDVFWYIEASANWFAAKRYPCVPNAFLEAESLVRIPQVAMWLGYDNFPGYYPENWQRYVHQYAMALFLFYLTEEVGVPTSVVCDGFYNGDELQMLLPQEYLCAEVGGEELREHFMDWAAHMTNDFDFILPSQRETAEEEWEAYADPDDDNEFVQVYLDSGSGGWYSPPDSLTTTAWSFNTYKVLNQSDAAYSFHLVGDSLGSEGEPSYFLGRVLVRNAITGASIYDLEMTGDTEGSVSVEVTEADTALCLIVGSLPEAFEGAEQLFHYQVSIEKAATSVGQTLRRRPPAARLDGCRPNPFGSMAVIEYVVPAGGSSASLAVYDLQGRLVAALVDGPVAAGRHDAVWDGRDASGEQVPCGVYLLRLQAEGTVDLGRLMLLR